MSEASLSHYRPVGPEKKKDEMAKLAGPQETDGRTILRLEVMIHRPSAVLAYGGQLDPSGSSLASCPDLHPELSRRTQVFVGARATGRPLPQGQRRRHRI